MASLSVSVSGVTVRSHEIDDEVAIEAIGYYVEEYKRQGAPVNGTGVEKLEWFVRDLLRHVSEVANVRAVTVGVEAERKRLLEERASKTLVEREELPVGPVDPKERG